MHKLKKHYKDISGVNSLWIIYTLLHFDKICVLIWLTFSNAKWDSLMVNLALWYTWETYTGFGLIIWFQWRVDFLSYSWNIWNSCRSTNFSGRQSIINMQVFVLELRVLHGRIGYFQMVQTSTLSARTSSSYIQVRACWWGLSIIRTVCITQHNALLMFLSSIS